MTKDEQIIALLILLHVFTLLLVCCVNDEIDMANKTLEQILATQEEHKWRLDGIEEMNESQENRLAEIEWVNKVQDYRLDIHRQELKDNAQMFSDLLDSTERLEEYIRSLPDNVWGIEITEQEEYLVASLVYLEAGGQGCSYELKKAIATVFFNQMTHYGLTVEQTIYRAGAFSVASRVRYTTPSVSCRMAVRDVLECGGNMPRNVMAFQLGGYHSFGSPFKRIQNVYFSTM